MAADAASATVKFARRINSSRNISRGISESSSPHISCNNISISRGTSESSPGISSNINSGTSNISDRSRNIGTRGISRDISHSSLHSIRGDGVHHAFVSGVVNTGIFCRSAVQYPARVFLTRTRAYKLRVIHILKTTPIWKRSFTTTVSPRAAGPAWTARSVRDVLELFQRTGHPGAIWATRQVSRTE